MIVLAAVGLVRIALAVQAAEVAIDSVKIQQDIRAEELQSKSLEADASALKAKYRIAAIADSSLNMTEAGKVSYVTVAAGDATESDASAAASDTDSGGFGAVVASVMDVAPERHSSARRRCRPVGR